MKKRGALTPLIWFSITNKAVHEKKGALNPLIWFLSPLIGHFLVEWPNPVFLLIVYYRLDDVRCAHAIRVLFKVFANVVLYGFSD